MSRFAILAGAAVVATVSVLAAPRDAHAAYYVYCANNRVEIAQSNPQQMRSARGSGTCLLSQFGFLGDAQSFAQRNFGGQGRPCSCR